MPKKRWAQNELRLNCVQIWTLIYVHFRIHCVLNMIEYVVKKMPMDIHFVVVVVILFSLISLIHLLITSLFPLCDILFYFDSMLKPTLHLFIFLRFLFIHIVFIFSELKILRYWCGDVVILSVVCKIKFQFGTFLMQNQTQDREMIANWYLI